MKKIYYFLAAAIISINTLSAQTGNVGISVPSPLSKLSVLGNMAIGSAYTGTVAPASGAIIQGNVGIGTSAPATKLDVIGKVRIADGTQADKRILVSDANGVASWVTPQNQALVLYNSAPQTILGGTPEDSFNNLVNFVLYGNIIPGASFDPATENLHLPQGSYEITICLEMDSLLNTTCPAEGLLIHSYLMDIPNDGMNNYPLNPGPMRLRFNASSICGTNGTHSALWSTKIIVPAAGQDMVLNLGRGTNGNYVDAVVIGLNSRIIVRKIQ
jgi:hypothetical protein